jgi:hypothetical protein
MPSVRLGVPFKLYAVAKRPTEDCAPIPLNLLASEALRCGAVNRPNSDIWRKRAWSLFAITRADSPAPLVHEIRAPKTEMAPGCSGAMIAE